MKKDLVFLSGTANLAACLLIIAAVGLGCTGFKRPWRDYSDRPFSSADWIAGDKIERGRMNHDIFKKRKEFAGLTPESLAEKLGPPDIKKTIEKREVWFYRVDIGIVGGMDLVPFSIDEKGRSMFGMVTGSTFSSMAKEEDLI